MCINNHTYVFNSHAWVVTKLTELLIILKKFVPPLGYIDIEESGGSLRVTESLLFHVRSE